MGERLISFSGLAIPILASTIEMAGKLNAQAYPTLSGIFFGVKESSLLLYIVLTFAFLVGKFFSRKGDKVIWETLQTQVDILQGIAFPEHSDDLNDNHRVTLFKYQKWYLARLFKFKYWPLVWRGWLVPVVRSGHTGKDTKTVFSVPDSGRQAEGIAGLCWSSDSIIHKESMRNISNASSDTNKNYYCKVSKMPRWMLDSYCDNEKPLARNILAFPVKTSRGNRWGVLVYDSMSATGIDMEKANNAFEIVIEPIGVLVEGV